MDLNTILPITALVIAIIIIILMLRDGGNKMFKKKVPVEETPEYKQQKAALEETKEEEIPNPFLKKTMAKIPEPKTKEQELAETIATSSDLWYKTQIALMQEEQVINTREILTILRKFDK